MALDQVFHIDVTQLGALRELHTGAHGRILAAPAVRINQRWPALYKEYHPQLRATLDRDALAAMVGLFTELDDETERWLCDRAAWPAAVVTRDGIPSGYLMCQAPAGLVPASELLAGRAGDIDQRAVRESVREAEAILTALHGWDVTIGPLDPGRFLLRQPAHAPRLPGCYLLDCAAFQRHGRAILPPADPDRDPDRDRALLAQLADALIQALPPTPDTEPEPLPATAPQQPAGPVPVAEAAALAAMSPPPQVPPVTVQPHRSRRWVAVLAGALVVLIASGAVAFALLRNQGPQPALVQPLPSPAPSSSPTASTTADAYAQATALDNLLSHSAGSRAGLTAALNSVCTDPYGSLTALRAVEAGRATELAAARQLQTGSLPNGDTIRSTLVAALAHSIDADRAFEGWAGYVAQAGCAHDANYQNGIAASQLAQEVKRAFVAIWNPVAAQFNLPQRTQDEI